MTEAEWRKSWDNAVGEISRARILCPAAPGIGLEEAIKELLRQRDEARADVERYRKAFTHMHKALYEGDELLRACAQCGLDISNEVHERLETKSDSASRTR